MRALIQRVSEASVTVAGEVVGQIERGLLVLLAVQRGDSEASATRMAEKLLSYRVFADEAGKMNCSVRDVGGALLVVSQFTLAADTRKGLRPSFSSAAEPAEAQRLYEFALRELDKSGLRIAAGVFAADMQVALVNDGPVTFLLET